MNTVYTVVLVVGLITLSMLLPWAFRTIAAACRKWKQRRQQRRALRNEAIAGYVRRRWQAQLPGLEQIARCPHCYVAVRRDGISERVPCQWHADIRSVAIERHFAVANGGQE